MSSVVAIACVAESASAERLRRREHAVPSGSFGGFLAPSAPVPVEPRPGLVAMSDLRSRESARLASLEAQQFSAEVGWDSLRRRFDDAETQHPKILERYGRARAAVFSPCFSRTEDDEAPEPAFGTTEGMAMIVDRHAGTLEAGLVAEASLVAALLTPGPALALAWNQVHERVRDPRWALGAMPRNTNARGVEFGPVTRHSKEGDREIERAVRVTVRGTPTDTLAKLVVVERRIEGRKPPVVVTTVKYCR